MKAGIHPQLQPAHVKCACGNEFDTASVRGDFKIDICSACHPFYLGSGHTRLVDTEGRVERFKRKYKRA
jgi:large subunit ribosomal protein L31